MTSLDQSMKWMVHIGFEHYSGRSALVQAALQRGLDTLVESAFARAGVDLTATARQNRGDSVLILFPEETDPRALLEVLMRTLPDELVKDQGPRLRVGIHYGRATYRIGGWTSPAVDHLLRLMEAPVIVRMLARESRAPMLLVASDEVHATASAHRIAGGSRGTLRPVDLVLKDGEQHRAWIGLPGHRIEPPPAATPPAAEALSAVTSLAVALATRLADLRGRPDEPPAPGGATELTRAAEETLDHTLARLFVRLGPPPEPTGNDYLPAGAGGGGAHQ
ncbi:hypothetical protein [Kitasatospora sp. NBC_00458]|uniref:hypothetical protein n=1 Tax=Kitasatospora sp. NBC_00458 TaxID=2903568 RepID=UPI002E1855E9